MVTEKIVPWGGCRSVQTQVSNVALRMLALVAARVFRVRTHAVCWSLYNDKHLHCATTYRYSDDVGGATSALHLWDKPIKSIQCLSRWHVRRSFRTFAHFRWNWMWTCPSLRTSLSLYHNCDSTTIRLGYDDATTHSTTTEVIEITIWVRFDCDTTTTTTQLRRKNDMFIFCSRRIASHGSRRVRYVVVGS